MGILTATSVLQSFSTLDAISYTTGSMANVATEPWLFAFIGNTAAAAAQPTVTSGGDSWTLVDTVASGTGGQRMTLFKVRVVDLSGDTLVIAFGGAGQTGCEWIVVEVADSDIEAGPGFEWADPVTQFDAVTGTAATSASWSLPSPTTADFFSICLAGWRHAANELKLPKGGSNGAAGWEEIADMQHASPNAGFQAQLAQFTTGGAPGDGSPSGSPGAQWSTSIAWVSAAVEIHPATAVAATRTAPRVITRAAVRRASVR